MKSDTDKDRETIAKLILLLDSINSGQGSDVGDRNLVVAEGPRIDQASRAPPQIDQDRPDIVRMC